MTELLLTILGGLLGILGFRVFSGMKKNALDVKHAEDKAVHNQKINQIDKMIEVLETKKIVVEKRPADLTDDEKVESWEERLGQVTSKDKK